MSNEIELSGLDGANPLGLFAAIGLLSVAERQDPSAKLGWQQAGGWTAKLTSKVSPDDLPGLVLEDAATWADEPVLQFAYTKAGERVAPDNPRAVLDLKPPPSIAHEFLDELAEVAARGSERSSRLATALLSDLVTDKKGKIKPTAFHFTAGTQEFLKMVRQLREGLAAELIEEALWGPWEAQSKLPSLAWNAGNERLYALRSTDPSNEKRGSVAGANWLGFLGLSAFPSFPSKGRIITTNVHGGWIDGRFSWPLWETPMSMPAIRSLVAHARVEQLGPQERSARGIVVVFTSNINRASKYGSFTPPRPI